MTHPLGAHLFDMEADFVADWQRCAPFTLTGPERGYALWQAVCHIARAGLAGDFVECGVWRGGSAMLMALAAQRFGIGHRHIHLFDTFAGMTAPGANDIEANSGRAAADLLAERPRDTDDPYWGLASRAAVEAAMASTGYAPGLIHYVEGDVLATLPAAAPDAIALLRLDTDWEASTRHELESLWPRLVPGGIIIIDDYGYWQGARAATDVFWATLGTAAPMLHRIDATGRIAVKI